MIVLNVTLIKGTSNHCKSLRRMNIDKNIDQPNTEVCEEANVMFRRSSTTPRGKPLSKSREQTNSKDLKCVFCMSVRVWLKKSRKHEYNKYRFCCEERIKTFLNASRFFKDEVFCRTSGLNSCEDITASDLFYHDTCFKRYAAKYSSCINSGDQNQNCSAYATKKELFRLALKDIYPRIQEGVGFTMSEIRDYMSMLDKDYVYIYRSPTDVESS